MCERDVPLWEHHATTRNNLIGHDKDHAAELSNLIGGGNHVAGDSESHWWDIPGNRWSRLGII